MTSQEQAKTAAAERTVKETGAAAALVLSQYDRLIRTIRDYNPGADFAQIEKAFYYADAHHNGQLRKDGSPFVTHPLAVAQIIAESCGSIPNRSRRRCCTTASRTPARPMKRLPGSSPPPWPTLWRAFPS